MKAPPTSQTVLLAKPENAHLTASEAILNPGFANSALLNNVQRETAAVSAMAMKPVAAGGTGSTTSAATTPANKEKYHHACWLRPGGGGMTASTTAIRTGMIQRRTLGARSTFAVPAVVSLCIVHPPSCSRPSVRQCRLWSVRKWATHIFVAPPALTLT